MTADNEKRSKAKDVLNRTLSVEPTTEQQSGRSLDHRANSPLSKQGNDDSKRQLLEQMRRELQDIDPAIDDERLEIIRSRIESGFYQEGAERSTIIDRILNDLLGTDPF